MANTLGDKFKEYIKKECNSLVWLYPGGCTDALQPIDAGLGALIKVEVGKHLDLWRGNGTNLGRWESNALTASDRLVLLTKRVAAAVDTVDNRPNHRFRLFDKTRERDDGGRGTYVTTESSSRG